MTTLIDDLGDLLVTGGFGVYPNPPTVEGSLFIGFRPPHPDNCLVVLEYGGMEPVRTMSNPIPKMSMPRVQMLSRNFDLVAARNLSFSVYRYFETISQRVVNGDMYYAIEALQEPFLLHEDADARFVYIQNFQVWKEPE